jgi:hypothetical protein
MHDEELHELKTALSALDAGLDRLRAARATLTELLDETHGRVVMPNSRRAEQQLGTALNAATGARKLLEHRLDLRRGAAPDGRPRLIAGGDPLAVSEDKEAILGTEPDRFAGKDPARAGLADLMIESPYRPCESAVPTVVPTSSAGPAISRRIPSDRPSAPSGTGAGPRWRRSSE